MNSNVATTEGFGELEFSLCKTTSEKMPHILSEKMSEVG